jgi:multimeric flavodoxin WrbA
MQKILDEIDHADALVFGSPVYMGQMTAQAKIFTDRLFPIFSPRFSPYFKEGNTSKKKLVFIFNQGNPDSSLFQTYIDYTNRMFELLGFDVKEVPAVAGMRNGPAHERKDLLSAMKDIGSSLTFDTVISLQV